MTTAITVIHVIACTLLVLVILPQAGKGAEVSASFGGGGSQSILGSGGGNFLTRFTSAMAAVFMITSVALTLISHRSKKSLFEATPGSTAPVTAPAAPAQAPASQPAAPKN